MSVKAVLTIDDDIEINILSYRFSYQKQADINGRPTNKAVFNGVHFVIESRKGLNLADWATAQNEKKQLKIQIYPRFMGSKTRKIVLYDCHLLHWRNDFLSTGTDPLQETLYVSCAGVKDSNSSTQYDAYWRQTYDSTATPVILSQDEEQEVHIISCNYTDKEGTPIEELYEGDEIILIVNTEDCVGKTIDIDLTEFEFGFKHNNKIVKKNILRSVKVTADDHKINLDVIEKEED